MIQKFLTKYWLPFHVLVLFVVVSLNVFGMASAGEAALFWLSLLGLEALMLLPSVFKAESLPEARKRVLRSLEDDAFSYIGFLLVVLVAIQWLNSGCTLVYFSDADLWKYSMPPVEWLPYSITPRPSLELLSLVAALFSGILIIRNGLGKAGRHFLLETASFLSGMIAVYAVFKSHAGVAPYAGWALTPGASNVGAFFAIWFFIASGRDLDSAPESPSGAFFKGLAWWIFAFIGNLLGLLEFSTGVGIVVYAAVGGVLLVYRLMILGLQRASIGKQFRFGMGIVLVVTLITGSLFFLMPTSTIKARVVSISDDVQWKDYLVSRQLRTTAAMKIWEEAPWTGVGPQGFSHYLGSVIEDTDWKIFKADRRYVWNDFLQFLCEWGVIGSGMLLAIVIVLLIPLFVRFRHLFAGQGGDSESIKEIVLSLDAYFVPGLVAVLTLLVYGWWSSLFQNSLTFLSWCFVLALVPGLLPSRQMRKN